MTKSIPLFLLSSLALVRVAASNPNGGKWKVDDTGALVADADGNPILVLPTGGEQTVAVDTIARLNSEAKQHRTRAETAEAKLKTFEGVDPEQAKKDREIAERVGQNELIEKGQLDTVKAEITKQYETQLNEEKTERERLQAAHNNLLIDNAFNSSEFIKTAVAVPGDMFRSTFGKNFQVKDGVVVAVDSAGNQLYSKKKAGEFAGFDEALEIVVDGYAHKDSILKAPDQRGSGNNGEGGNRGGSKFMKRSDFEALDTNAKAAAATSMQKGELKLIS